MAQNSESLYVRCSDLTIDAGRQADTAPVARERLRNVAGIDTACLAGLQACFGERWWPRRRVRTPRWIQYTSLPPLDGANARIRQAADSCIVGPHPTALSPPAFEQCPVFPRVRADRPISANNRSADERSVEYASLDPQSRGTAISSSQGWRRQAAAPRRRVTVVRAGKYAVPHADRITLAKETTAVLLALRMAPSSVMGEASAPGVAGILREVHSNEMKRIRR